MDKSILEEITSPATEQMNENYSPAREEMNENYSPVPKGLGIDLSILKTKTGEGGIENYQDHPLNFNKSKGMAQMIRGFTGLFGALDLAIIDIIVGFLQVAKEKKVVNDVNRL